MATEVRMARLSPTMETGTINRWLKKEGDTVSSGEAVAEVETDKASMPLEVFEDGKLLKILVPEGATVRVDDLVAVLGESGEDVSGFQAAAPAAKADKKTVSPSKTRQAGAQGAPPAVPAKVTTATATAEPAGNGGRVKASPLAKRLAAERGIDLRTIQPSGPGGRIVERDVPTAPLPADKGEIQRGAPAVPVTAAGEDIPLSNMRQTIARRLLQSKQTIPHWYCFADVRMDRAMQFREELNAHLPEGAAKISVNDLVLKVCATALKRHPEVNASFNQTPSVSPPSIRRYSEVGIGFAVATDDGLYTPVLRNADRLGLSEISAGVKSLAQKAREKKLKAEDFGNAGFTVSNLGMFGVDHFFAIINPPESAILAVGAVKPQPVVNEAGQVVAAKVMSLALSCDHRVIDGAVGARFMQTIRELLENPVRLLL